ncbi:MAG: hypothetical protein K1W17_04170 [Oscillospiraceae bacterium]
MKKFDFLETLKSHGFSLETSGTGSPVFTLVLSRPVDVASFGVSELKLSILVELNKAGTCCEVSYYHGFSTQGFPFKSKVHLADGLAWNAICKTAKNNGFEIREVS